MRLGEPDQRELGVGFTTMRPACDTEVNAHLVCRMSPTKQGTVSCDGVAFDADGVLFDSTDSVVAAWSEVCARYGLGIERVLVHGIPAQAILSAWLRPEDVPTAVGLLEDREVELAAQVEPLPGAARLLADLPNDRCAIVTSASRRLLLARLGGSGLSAPDVLITADDVALGKPDPEAYTAAAAQLRVPARGLVVFEDAPAGLRAARDAGAVTVGLTTTHAPNDLPADYHIPNLSAARIASLEPLALALS